MSRKTREQRLVPEIPNHVIVRGNNRRRFFSYQNDYSTFVWLLAQATCMTSCHLNAASLMANHVHKILTPPTVEAASTCMRKLDQRYAQIRNKRRGGTGKLFEERFYSAPIEDSHHLMAATMYVDANPLRAGVVTDAADYPWSTYNLHIGEPNRCAIPAAIWTPSEWYRSLGKTPSQCARTYRRLFEEYVSHDENLDESDWRVFARREQPYVQRLRRPDGTSAREPNALGWKRRK